MFIIFSYRCLLSFHISKQKWLKSQLTLLEHLKQHFQCVAFQDCKSCEVTCVLLQNCKGNLLILPRIGEKKTYESHATTRTRSKGQMKKPDLGLCKYILSGLCCSFKSDIHHCKQPVKLGHLRKNIGRDEGKIELSLKVGLFNLTWQK